ncbi:TPM domain-containing protein [Treponema sp.]|uniref:TPM domain-containing protein n=1 Tax=Treponema sp. TaxID=166 RepID=UPI00298E58C1|nr:TPM domain-containing protein [Treponema sp.]MCR5612339.1 TPM domain-containing protein [Treponema sp.]
MKTKKILSAVLCSFVAAFSLSALTVPELTGPVIDNARIISAEKEKILDEELRAISEQTGTQIVVLTIGSLEGLDMDSYTMAVAEKWKIGSAKNDDGVILFVSLKERKIRIEVGYGLEPSLTDAKCGMIIRNIMAPKFQQSRYEEGIVDAVTAIEEIIGAKPSGTIKLEQSEREPDSTAFPIVMFFILFYIIMISGALSTKFRGLRWLPWAFLFMNSGKGHYRSSHHSNDFFGGSSGGFGGGFGGGGFSGGGGGFGGGGASGGW